MGTPLLTRLLCVVSFATIAAFAHAQTSLDFGKTGPQSSFYFLLDADVQKDLGLSKQQVDQIDTIKNEMQAGISRTLGAMLPKPGEEVDREKIGAAITQHTKTADDKSQKVLSKSQQKRFGELELQLLSGYALTRPEIQKKLKLSSNQKTKIDALVNGGTSANGDGRKVSTVNQMKAQEEKQKRALLSVLTSSQSEQFKKMQGNPLKRAKKD